MTDYGVVIMRAQPFHNGHNSIIQQIIRDGRKPIIILGGANVHDDRHPLNVATRSALIELVYPDNQVIVRAINDSDDWDVWYQSLYDYVLPTNGTFTIYGHVKPEDRITFVCKDRIFTNSTYLDIFELDGIPIEYISTYTDNSGTTVSATTIRTNEQYAIEHLDARIYTTLKEIGWWK